MEIWWLTCDSFNGSIASAWKLTRKKLLSSPSKRQKDTSSNQPGSTTPSSVGAHPGSRHRSFPAKGPFYLKAPLVEATKQTRLPLRAHIHTRRTGRKLNLAMQEVVLPYQDDVRRGPTRRPRDANDTQRNTVEDVRCTRRPRHARRRSGRCSSHRRPSGYRPARVVR